MTTTALLDLMVSAFQAHGYACSTGAELEGRSGQVFTAPMLAEGADGVFIVEVSQNREPLDEATLEDLQTVTADTGADLTILAHLGPEVPRPPPSVRVWGREKLERFLGPALLAHALGEAAEGGLPLAVALESEGASPPAPVALWAGRGGQPPSSPAASDTPATQDAIDDDRDLPVFDGVVAELGAALAADLYDSPPSATSPSHATEQEVDSRPRVWPPLGGGHVGGPSPGRTIIVEDDPDVIDYAAKPEAPGPEPSPPAAPAPAGAPLRGPVAPSRPTRDPHIPLIPLRLDEDAARGYVADRLYGDVVADLRLQPVWRFDYTCELFEEGSLKSQTVTGRVQVDGSTRRLSAVDPRQTDHDEAAAVPNVARDQRPLRVGPDRAQEEARAYVIDLNSRVVDVTVDDPDAGFSVVEKRRVEPQHDLVSIKPLPLAHRPQWVLRGSNGVVVIDAVTGKLLDEELVRADSDTFVL